jgi:hypothetical protein
MNATRKPLRLNRETVRMLSGPPPQVFARAAKLAGRYAAAEDQTRPCSYTCEENPSVNESCIMSCIDYPTLYVCLPDSGVSCQPSFDTNCTM